MEAVLKNKSAVNAHGFIQEKAKFDEIVDELNQIESFDEIVPDYDEQCLMVHWSNTA
jgi:hypothetical protein